MGLFYSAFPLLVSLKLRPNHSMLQLLPGYVSPYKSPAYHVNLAWKPTVPKANLFFISFTKPFFCPAPHRHNRYHFTADLRAHRVRCHGNTKANETGNKCSDGHNRPGPPVLPSPSPPLEKRRKMCCYCDSAKHGYLELLLSHPHSSKSPQTCFETSQRCSTNEGLHEMQSVHPGAPPAFPKGRTHTKVCKAQGSSTSPYPPVQPPRAWMALQQVPSDSVSPRF